MEDRDHGPAKNLPESPDDEEAGVVDDEEGDIRGGFTFPVPPLAADGACIVPVYPILGRPPSPPPASLEDEPETATVRMPLGRLLLEERDFRARQLLLEERDFRARQRDGSRVPPQPDEEGGGDGELEGVPPESYCLWAPGQLAPAPPRRCQKSGSTGSALRWQRISERLVGRSQSDGKEKFVFLSATGPEPPKQEDEEEGGRKGDGGAGLGGRGWSYYGKGGGGRGGGRRRSYLPYKQELVGLFANVSGLRRSYHPF